MRSIASFLFLIVRVSSYHSADENPSEELKRALVLQDGSLNAPQNHVEHTPYAAQLVNARGVVGCLATIISEDWLITAAHCIHDRDLRMIKVVTGSSNHGFHGKVSSIEKIEFHEYDPCTRENDIALIKLEQSLEIDERQKPLPISNVRPAIGDKMKVTRLDQNSGKLFTELKSEEDLVKQLPKCQNDVGNKRCGFKESHTSCLIFGQTHGHATLEHGDSGGPAVINDHLVGVIRSRKYNRNKTKYTSVYINVYEYRNWIGKTTGISCSNSITVGCSLMK